MHSADLSRRFFLPLVLSAQCLACASVDAQATKQDIVSSTSGTSAGLEIETLAERRVVTASSEGAQVEFVAAKQLHLGDEIFYTLRVRNASNVAIDDVVVIKQVPRNTQYVDESAVGPAAIVTFSIDGGATFASADDLEVMTLPGVARTATPSDYTHLRWQMRHPLAAGATALLRFRGIFR